MSGAPYGRVSPGLTAAADGGSPASQRHGGISPATFRAHRHRRSRCDPSHTATHGRPDPATSQHANLCDLVLGDLVLGDLVLGDLVLCDLVLRDPTAASAIAGRGPKMQRTRA